MYHRVLYVCAFSRYAYNALLYHSIEHFCKSSILVNLRYLRFKLLKYKENNKKICKTFYHNFKNIPLYIMRKVSLEMYYFVLYDCAITSQMSKMALKSFCDKTLHIYIYIYIYIYIQVYTGWPKKTDSQCGPNLTKFSHIRR